MMSLRYAFSVVLFGIFLNVFAKAQATSKNACAEKGEYPWIGDGCISKSSFTGIFISSIVFACLSFILLAVLLGLFIWNKVKGSSSDSDSDTETGSSRSSSRSNSIESYASKVDPPAPRQAKPEPPPPATRPKPIRKANTKPAPVPDDDYSSQF